MAKAKKDYVGIATRSVNKSMEPLPFLELFWDATIHSYNNAQYQ